MRIWLNDLFIISETGKSSPLISSASVPKVTFDPLNHMFPKHPQQPRAETTVELLKGLDPNRRKQDIPYTNQVLVPNNGNRSLM